MVGKVFDLNVLTITLTPDYTQRGRDAAICAYGAAGRGTPRPYNNMLIFMPMQ